MADHTIDVYKTETWPDRQSTRVRVRCTAGCLDVKIAGLGVDEVLDALTAQHEQAGEVGR